MTSYSASYEQAIEFLFSRINFERLSGTQYSADDFKLDRMREFLRRLGDPQWSIPVIHVAGTKGKGSTAAYLASILTAAGYRTGLFTSPHVSAFEERMAVDGVPPTREELAALVAGVSDVVAALDKTPGRMSPTYFEITTALAWLYFRQREATIAVLEVGMGGRLDATNICRPLVSVITTISRDHTRQLGSRIDQIAREKAGIIKPGVPLVSGVSHPDAQAVIAEVCRQQRAPLLQAGREFDFKYQPPVDRAGPSVTVRVGGITWRDVPLSLVGEHQGANAAVALAALDQLGLQGWHVAPEAILEGMRTLRWPGRIELLGRDPTVIVDAAHNWAAVGALLKTLDQSYVARRRVLIFAATRDKDFVGMLRQLLPRFDSIILTSFQNNPRNVPVAELRGVAESLSDRLLHFASDPAAAWKLARRLVGPPDLICATGSFFLAAELRELILDERPQPVPEKVADRVPG
ncbi:MAG: bifunctional folylpolyglutamate synthase/dihydrofolate synthase [Planctomycetales bacterium]